MDFYIFLCQLFFWSLRAVQPFTGTVMAQESRQYLQSIKSTFQIESNSEFHAELGWLHLQQTDQSMRGVLAY